MFSLLQRVRADANYSCTSGSSTRLPYELVFCGPFNSGKKEDISVLPQTFVRKLSQATFNMVDVMTLFGLHDEVSGFKGFLFAHV